MYPFLKPMVIGVALAGLPVWAEDRALIVGNDYADRSSALNVASETALAVRSLSAAGFTVLEGRNLATDALRARLSRLLADLQPTDSLVILLAGDFAHSQGQTWFLPPDATAPAEKSLATIGATGVSLATVLELAGLAAGRAVVVLGHDEGLRLPLGKGLSAGIGPLAIPQGVAVVTGGAADVARFTAFTLAQPGQSLAQMLKGARNLVAEGYLPAEQPFRPVPPVTAGQPATGNPVQALEAEAERVAWALAQKTGTIAGYESFLAKHPRGQNAAAARAELTRLRNDPTVLAQLAEDALKLDRDQRRTIQRQLSLLGFDPRGVDGIFGRGSRAAISAWQKAQGALATGYLSAAELPRLALQADRRAAELEAEAAARQAELERQDRRFWQDTGAAGDEAGLRAYMRKYPDGLFADVAKARLDAIEADLRAQAAAQDRQAWDRAEALNTVAGYRDYLNAFPSGAFAAEAQARLDAALLGSDEARSAAEAAERQLKLNLLTRRLIEERLAGLGFDPGPTDGNFDDATRRAIRRFQNARGQEVTGFIDEGAIVALLAGGILKLGD